MPFIPRLSLPPINDPAPAGGDGTADHGNLDGLADDDHTQYALANGSRGTFEVAGAAATAQAAAEATAAAALTAHEGAGNPHPAYATDVDVTALINAFIDHEAAIDPHPGYQQESEKGNANGYCGLGADGKVAAAQFYTQVATLAGNQATGANTTPVTLTGLVFSYAANSKYRIWFMGRIKAGAATTGCGFQFDLSSVVTAIDVQFYHQLANTGTQTGGHSLADDASVGVSSGTPSTSDIPVSGEGLLVTGANTGTAQLRFRSETTAVITAIAGLTLVVEKIA